MDANQVVFLSCSKSKLDRPAPARELYTGTLFRLALRYAEEGRGVTEIYVFSAKYGVVPIGKKIAPYSLVMNNSGLAKEVGAGMTFAQRKEWYEKVIPEVESICLGKKPIYLCNSSYRKGMPQGEVPMQGLTFWKCLRWLSNQLKENRK